MLTHAELPAEGVPLVAGQQTSVVNSCTLPEHCMAADFGSHTWHNPVNEGCIEGVVSTDR